MTDKNIPLIDFAKIEDSQTILTLDKALRNSGFFYLKNHSIKPKIQNRLLELSKKFFAEPLEKKMKIEMKKGGMAWRGYFPVGGELTSGKPDQKEGLYFGQDLGVEHPTVRNKTPLHGANLWPKGPYQGEFKTLVLENIDQLTLLGQALMAAVGRGLGLPKDYFKKRFTDEPTTLFRIFNYPKHVWSDPEDQWGVREHTDMGFLTILLQDQSGGLQIKGPNKQWISAPPVEGTFVINIGDMLEVWTHGIYRATPHRVRNEGKTDRLSLPFFFDPNWNCTLTAIDKNLLPPDKLAAVPSETQERWDGLKLRELAGKLTYGEFVWNKVKNVFPDLVSV